MNPTPAPFGQMAKGPPLEPDDPDAATQDECGACGGQQRYGADCTCTLGRNQRPWHEPRRTIA